MGDNSMLDPARQWKHFAAMLLIGDGVMALVRPEWDAEAWAVGPEWWKQSMRFFRRRPALTRLIAATQISTGIWWALSQENSGEEQPGQQRESESLRAA